MRSSVASKTLSLTTTMSKMTQTVRTSTTSEEAEEDSEEQETEEEEALEETEETGRTEEEGHKLAPSVTTVIGLKHFGRFPRWTPTTGQKTALATFPKRSELSLTRK